MQRGLGFVSIPWSEDTPPQPKTLEVTTEFLVDFPPLQLCHQFQSPCSTIAAAAAAAPPPGDIAEPRKAIWKCACCRHPNP